eukprot:TRINITY_DN2823_c0_g1_i1.p2 TRINITY_DN2823_c0_g1~~TRINITY_DN2823_c0_g1_i1.p2  ORF type:complete len:109 (+),score=2.28 TRINITY_DN2823_c0_g1_i1:498-824(+)
MAETSSAHHLLRALQNPRRVLQKRMQHVLSRLHVLCPLLVLPCPSFRPPGHSDQKIIVPRRDQSIRNWQVSRYHRRTDVCHKQCEGRVLEREASAKSFEGRLQHLPRL